MSRNQRNFLSMNKNEWGRTKTRQTRCRKKSNMSLNYEPLEAKNLLATFMVTTAADTIAADGLVSLREAIVAADTNAVVGDAAAGDIDGDRIFFDASLASQTISLANGEFTVTDDLGIYGNELNITIDANSSSRIFNVATAERVVLREFNLINGDVADSGGAILSTGSGTTVLNGLSIQSSTASGTGGGAVATSSGNLALLNSTLRGNMADGASGSGGGLLVTSGTTNIFRSTIDANVANRAGGGIEIIDGTLNITQSTLGGVETGDGNIAGPAGTAAPGNGGAIHVTGIDNTRVNIVASDVLNNFAAREGGGLWNQSGSTMVVSNSNVTGNEAAGSAADDGGGGIFNNGGDLFVNQSILGDNHATGASGSGGGIFSTGGKVVVQRQSVISANSASRAGGGVEIVDGNFLMIDSTLGGDVITDGNLAGTELFSAPGNGGGLHVTGAATSFFSNSLIASNEAAREGGGLWNQAGSTLIVKDSKVRNNIARGDAADDGGGGIFNNGGSTYVLNSMLELNLATGSAGSGGGIFSTAGLVAVTDSTISANVANRAGGGIEVVGGTVIVKDSVLGGATTASGNIAGPNGSASPGNGGALHVSGTNGTFTAIVDSEVQNNFAAREGGGLWNQSGSRMLVRDGSIISDNVAQGDAADDGGGGVFNNGGDLTVLDSFIAANFASGLSGSGGGIFSTDGNVFVRNSEISANYANRAGGGIEVVDGVVFLQDSLLGSLQADGGNIAGAGMDASPGNGGGLHVTGTNGTQTIVDNTIVRFNVAANEGGGLWNQTGSNLVVRNGSLVTGNQAGAGGGGGILNRGTMEVAESLVNRNSTTGDGGAIKAIAGSESDLTDSDVTRNSANENGGGIFNNGMFTIVDSSIDFNQAGLDGGGVFTEFNGSTNISGTSLFGNTPNDQA